MHNSHTTPAWKFSWFQKIIIPLQKFYLFEKKEIRKKKDLISLFLFASQSPQYARIWIEEYSSTFVPRKVSSRNTRFITDMQAKHIKSVIFLNRSFWTGTELEILLLQEGN